MSIIKIFFLALIFASILNATENFSEMSTQELIAIIGYVKKADEEKFKAEIKSRIPFMSDEEKNKYDKNIQKKK